MNAQRAAGATLFGSPCRPALLSAPAEPVFLGPFAALAAVAWCSARLIRVHRHGGAGVVPAAVRLGATVLPLADGVSLHTTTAWATAERAYLRRIYFDG